MYVFTDVCVVYACVGHSGDVNDFIGHFHRGGATSVEAMVDGLDTSC